MNINGKFYFMEDYDFFECEGGTLSKASCARILQTIILFGGEIAGTFTLDSSYNRASVFYIIKIPRELKSDFEKRTKTTLKTPMELTVNTWICRRDD